VGELIDDLFRDPVIRRSIAEGRLPRTWAEVAGPMVASCTDAVEFRRGILTVRISSSVVRHETFMRRTSLRDAINAASGHDLVRELIVK
jgi:predicted nucleic acid-binding Zn ribbon protein